MSDRSIFKFTARASANTSVSASAFHHAALDADASARLAAMDHDFTEADPADEDEVEFQQAEGAENSASPAPESADETPDVTAEVTGIFAAATAATEIMHQPSVAPEPAAEEITILDAVITDAAEPDPESELNALATLEVAPILDASGELQPGVNDYTPPSPFEIRVPESLTMTEMPVADLPVATARETAALPGEENLSETFDLDEMCAPTEAEQIIDKAIAQEEAVAEINAAAEEFVAGQIASDACAEARNDSHHDAHTAALMSEAPPTDSAPRSAMSSSATNEREVASPVASPLESAAAALKAEPASDRRRKRRALISAPIRVRSIDITTSGPDEIATTVDVSRYGILFYTVLDTYQRGMDVAVVFPYHKSATGPQTEQFGRVVRLHDMPDGRHAVAVALGVGYGEHLVDASGRKLGGSEPVQISNPTAPPVKRPLVLMADSDAMLRDTMKIYLQNEGYEVIAVNNANDAREVLNMFMPAMIVAEIEGEGDVLPGLDLCAHVKSSPSLKHLPVVLTSRSAYPSDYSNAHSLGAVVCMAKPYKPERLGHIVRLLAPLPEHLQATGAQRVPDPTRGFRSDSNVTSRNANKGTERNGVKKSTTNATKNRFKFPSFR